MNSQLSISSRTTQTSSVFSAEEDGLDARIKEIEDYYVRTLLDEEPSFEQKPRITGFPLHTKQQQQQQQHVVRRSGQMPAAPQLEVQINPQYMPATGVMPLTSENLKLLQNPKLAPQRPECLAPPEEPTSAQGSGSRAHQSAANEKCNRTLYKTELCESFSTTGHCRYGSNCQFAHGLQELKFKERNNKFRTKPCLNWIKSGSCPYGQRCCFKHGDDVDIEVYLQAGHIPNSHHLASAGTGRRNHHANVRALQKMAW
ncbi:LAME_0F15522g1_1 [Lachancea meyersii CBS 8951]|uniref:LAME_0F15522g1_1 n=1 Tax=Lachancea meyersii CBS 8951 TaxID=1266667 RepID=A0A1G4JYL0_9SACH|nr:LAME_0F15522g1_1 [Lachancea meyersii CBS 8951]